MVHTGAEPPPGLQVYKEFNEIVEALPTFKVLPAVLSKTDAFACVAEA